MLLAYSCLGYKFLQCHRDGIKSPGGGAQESVILMISSDNTSASKLDGQIKTWATGEGDISKKGTRKFPSNHSLTLGDLRKTNK